MQSPLLGLIAAISVGAAATASPLIDAVRSGDPATARVLIEDGADVRMRDPDGSTALLWASYAGLADTAEALIAAGADLTAANMFGATPTGEAALAGDAEILRLLLDAGADPNEAGADGQTPLMAAARGGHLDAARLLVERGADVNAVESWRGQTALMWAAARSQSETIAFLLAHGADANARSTVNNYARQITAEPRAMYRAAGGLTPLMFAARQGCAACIEALVAGGAEVDLADPEGVTPLIVATTNLHFDSARLLIEAGANPNKWDWRGISPLYAAVDVSTLPHGGRPDRPSLDETTALELAALLLDAGADPNLQLKLHPGYRNVKDDRGADRMLTIGTTPLLRAAKAFDLPMVELLLAHGALTELPTVNGVTPLMAAAGLGSSTNDTRGSYEGADVQSRAVATIDLLLAAGADLEAKDVNGRTPMFGAVLWGWNDVVRHLSEKGARLDVVDDSGAGLRDAAQGRIAGGRAAGPTPETLALIDELGAPAG